MKKIRSDSQIYIWGPKYINDESGCRSAQHKGAEIIQIEPSYGGNYIVEVIIHDSSLTHGIEWVDMYRYC